MKPDHKKGRSKKHKKGYCKAHERKRRNSGKTFKSRFKVMFKVVEEFLKGYPRYKQIKCTLVSWIMMKRFDCDIREMVEEYNSRHGLPKKVGLGRIPSKSWLHKQMGLIPMDLLDALVLFTAGKMARKDADRGLGTPYVEQARRGERSQEWNILQTGHDQAPWLDDTKRQDSCQRRDGR